MCKAKEVLLVYLVLASSLYVLCLDVSWNGVLGDDAFEGNGHEDVPRYEKTDTYGELAANTALMFDIMIDAMNEFNVTTMPDHAKALRKGLSYCRDFLDMFVFAYPFDGRPEDDMWFKIRKHLNWGHNVVGAFKDLYDAGIEYSEDDLLRLRNGVLEWKAAMEQVAPKHREYLANPFKHVLFIRDEVVLSRKMYWGAVHERPKLMFTGLQNLAFLTKLSLAHAIEMWDSVRAIPTSDVLLPESILTYHNFRKFIRAVADTVMFFPDVLTTPDAMPLMQICEDADRNIGNIMDKVAYFEYVEKTGNRSAMTETAAEINTLWAELLDWVMEIDMLTKFRQLSQMLIL